MKEAFVSNSEHRKMRLEQAEQVMASSLSVREWCELNHVAESTMYYWLKIYREQAGRKQTARNDWIEVSRTRAREATALALRDGESADATTVPNCDESAFVPSSATPMRIMIDGVGIEVTPGTRKDDIVQVLRAVKSL